MPNQPETGAAGFHSNATSVEGVWADLQTYMVRQMNTQGLIHPSQGTTRPLGIASPTNAQEFTANITNLMSDHRANYGRRAHDRRVQPVETGYRARRYEHFSGFEGVMTYAYDDRTGRRVDHSNLQGFVSIGIGFNMDRSGAREAFNAALPEVDFDRVYSGQQDLTEAQVQRLFDHDVENTFESFIDGRFRGVDLLEGQRLALVSLAYGAPALVGPRLTEFVTNGDHVRAINEILYNSLGFRRTDRFAPVIAGRRWHEARTYAQAVGLSHLLPDYNRFVESFRT